MVKFNFTYNMFLSTGKDGRKGAGGTGLELPNGTWIGVVGDVGSGRADIGIVSGATASRMLQVDFTNSYFETNYIGFITCEGGRVYSPKALFWTFTPPMWICLLITGLIGFLFFKFLLILSLKLSDPRGATRRGIHFKSNWGLKNEIFFFFRTYISRNTKMPRFQPLRFFLALWLFFTLIIKSVYRSKLVSLLAVPLIDTIPETFEELAFSDYEVGIIKRGDALFNSLKASKDPVYLQLLAKMDVISGVGLECLERVLRRDYACIAYDFEIRYLKARNLSEWEMRGLVLAPTATFNMWVGLMTEGGSMLKSNLDSSLRHTRPFHLQEIWLQADLEQNVRRPKRDWWTRTNQTQKLEPIPHRAPNLKLKNIIGTFYLLIAGLISAFIIFLFDYIRFHKFNKRLDRVTNIT